MEPAGEPTPPLSRTASLNGRVLLEDGSEVADTLSLGEIAVTAEGTSVNVPSTILKLDPDGNFRHAFKAGDYRFKVAVFSGDYIIRSVTADGIDLRTDSLTLNGDMPISVEIRVARRVDTGDGRVLGTVIEAVTNAASSADRIVLCCFASGGAERISTHVQPDGTFAFHGIPSGRYTAELRGGNSLDVANPVVEVAPGGVSALKLYASPAMATVEVTVSLDTGDRLPYKPDTSIVFTGSSGAFRVAASVVVGNLFRASVPSGGEYAVTVSKTAAGYSIKSIVDANQTDLLHGGLFIASSRPAAPSRIVVTLTKN